MKIAAALLWLFAATSDVLSATETNALEEARAALREGLPQVAIQKLERQLADAPASEQVRLVTITLARAYLAHHQPEKARHLLTTLTGREEIDFLIVQSYLAENNWAEVDRRLQVLPLTDSPFHAASIFARAEARRGLGQSVAASQDYQSIQKDPSLGAAARLRHAELALEGSPDEAKAIRLMASETSSSGKAATLLTAQAQLLARQYREAAHSFEALVNNPVYLTASAYAVAYFGLADALSRQNDFDGAADSLEKFIEERPVHERLAEAFSELNKAYIQVRNSSQSQLRRWSRESAHPERQALSIYYQSLFDSRDKGSEAALETLAGWLNKFPDHPLRPSVLLRYGEQLVVGKKLNQAIMHLSEALELPAPDDLKGRLHVVLAEAFFKDEQYPLAADHFQEASQVLTSFRGELLYNAALCWLRADDLAEFEKSATQLKGAFPASSLARALELEAGLLQARSIHPADARRRLVSFIEETPEHPRSADAHLALAELSLEDAPEVAQRQLLLAAQANPANDVAERAAYLQFFGIDSAAPLDNKKQIAQCETFLKQFPKTTLEPEVRFKLGEAYFSEKNYTAAGTQFEVIAKSYPESTLLEQARFLAAQAAIRTMNPRAIDSAISLLEQVVRMKGPLQSYARFEQAEVKKNSGAYNEALVLYNDLLGQSPPADLLAPALAGKGEALFLQGSSDLQKVHESVETFDQMATIPNLSLYWRNLALYKKSKGLAWLGKKDQMLEACYDALSTPPNSNEPREFYWSYRAGFDAAETLEGDEQWKASIAIYQKLVDAKGPRSSEAGERIKRLRLEHFIWD